MRETFSRNRKPYISTSGTNNAQGNIIMGNADNSSNSSNNGRVTINKLQIGSDGPVIRYLRYGKNGAGSSAIGTITFSPAFPSGTTPYIICQNFTNNSSDQNYVFTTHVNTRSNTGFTFAKMVYLGAGFTTIQTSTTCGFDWIAWLN